MDGVAPRAPLVPHDCNLQDFSRMMIDIPRLRASTFDSTLNDAAWRAGMNLWMAAWHSVPAASLDDDDGALCKAAGLGRDLRTWNELRDIVMRGWVRCDDGRLYHPTVAEFALEAWLEKLAQSLSSGHGNAKRWKNSFDPAPIRQAILDTLEMLGALNPRSKALKKSRPYLNSTPDGKPSRSERDADAIPSGSQEKGTGKEDREADASLSDAGAAAPGRKGLAEPLDGEFRVLQTAYGERVIRGRGSVVMARSHWLRLSPDDRRRVLQAVKPFAAAKPWGSHGPPSLHRFISEETWRDFLPDPGATVTSIVWNGPPELREAVLAEAGEAFTRSYLDPATWKADARSPTVIALTPAAAVRLRTVAALRDVAIQDPVLIRKHA